MPTCYEQKELGQHYIVDLLECNSDRLKFSDSIRELMLRAAEDCGATVVSNSFHQFKPNGVTGLLLLTESHISIHTWPEEDFAGLDIFTCGQNMKPELAIQAIAKALGSRLACVAVLSRGTRTSFQIRCETTDVAED